MILMSKFADYILESKFEKKVAGIIKKHGYAMFDNDKGEQVAITDIDDGWGYGLSNRDNDVEIDLSDMFMDWRLVEGTVAGDIAGTGDGFENDIRKKKLKPDEDKISEAMKGGLKDDLESCLLTIQDNCYSTRMEIAIDKVLDLMDTDC